MKCTNCGYELKEGAKVCPNCGTFCNDEEGYVLLTAENASFQDVSSKRHTKKKWRPGFLIIAILVIALVAAASYATFSYVNRNKSNPEVSFTSGCGIINKDERVVYVSINDAPEIQYIHGVSLYDDSSEGANLTESKLITSDYQYTKNIDSSFRTIFFDTDNLDAEKGKNHSYTFEMKFSFYDDQNIYTYTKSVDFNKKADSDVSDIVFDHSITSNGYNYQEDISVDPDEFIYNSYWYSIPYNDHVVCEMSVIKFNKDGHFTLTKYSKKAGEYWNAEVSEGTFKIRDDTITLSGADINYTIKTDSDSQRLTQMVNGEASYNYSAKRYNSIRYVSEFFR